MNMTSEQMIAHLTARGYKVTLPKPRASCWAEITGYKTSMRKWAMPIYEITFEDSVTVRGNALSDGKRVYTANAVRGACNKYRQRLMQYRKGRYYFEPTTSWNDFDVPKIVLCVIGGKQFDVNELNERTAVYRSIGQFAA